MTMEWQPIETAPKDGSVFLAWDAYGDNEGDVVACFWWIEAVEYGEEPEFTCTDFKTGDDALGCNLTHWMPLPTPPAP